MGRRPRRRRVSRWGRPLGGLLLAGLVGLALAAVWVRWQLQPVGQGTAVVMTIQRGAELGSIAAGLRRQRLIRHAGVFVAYVRWRGDADRIKAGRHRLSPMMSPAEILDQLIHGRQERNGLVTIPEGFTVRRIAERLKARGVIDDAQAFLRLAEQPAGLIRAPFDLPPTGLEGYLFPSTYDFGSRMPPARVAERMLREFDDQFREPYREEIRRSGRSLYEIVTVASMIEREAEVDVDRPLIAGVIQNRLRKGMRLQIDATVLYALGYHKNRVLYRDLRVDSPYNTYRRRGLPPGPIANPGLPSLLAALRPARHDYLFYVAGADRAHIFTRTEAEHNRAVARMRALRPRPGD